MTDRIELSSDERDFVSKYLTDKLTPSAGISRRGVDLLVDAINARRKATEVQQQIEDAAKRINEGIVPRGVVNPMVFGTNGTAELRTKIEYLRAYNAREDKLRTEALRLAWDCCKHDEATNVTEVADRFYKFLLDGTVSRPE